MTLSTTPVAVQDRHARVTGRARLPGEAPATLLRRDSGGQEPQRPERQGDDEDEPSDVTGHA